MPCARVLASFLALPSLRLILRARAVLEESMG